MRALKFIFILILAAVAGYFGAQVGGKPTVDPIAIKEESVFGRVMRTGILRCGYYIFPPVVMVDESASQLKGFSIDMMEALGKRANLKIEWSEEVTFGNWVPALQSKRFDAVCAPMWPEIPMARAVAFTEPMFYAGLSPLVRVDDDRFIEDDLERLNQSDVRFVTQDGNAIDTLTREAFPKAIINAMPSSVDGPTILQEIVTNKADVILMDRNGEIEYNKFNEKVKLKLIAPHKPVKVQPFTLVVGRDEMILKDFLDNAIQEMNNDGTIDRLLKRWEPEPNTYLRAAPPYRVEK